MHHERPVFFDPDRKRWPRFRRGLFAAALLFTIIFGGLVASVVINPVLPALKLPQSTLLPRGGHLAPPTPAQPAVIPSRRLADVKRSLEAERHRRPEALRARGHGAGQPLTAGFFVNWDDSSMTSLRENVASLDLLMPEWLHLKDGGGTVELDDRARQRLVLKFIAERRPDLKVMPLINNFDGRDWQGGVLAAMLANASARRRVVDQLVQYAAADRFPGISIDFENIPAGAIRGFLTFITELSAALHASGRVISVNVPADDDAFDYRAIARQADYVIVMAYDQHWPAGTPGPIAGIEWFERTLRRRLRDMPADRLIVALGNYAYDWTARATPAVERTFEEAILTAKESEGVIHYDAASLNPMFTYADDDDKLHQVWMLDATTAFNQLGIAKNIGARGVALWRLGSEDPSIWTFFGKPVAFDDHAASALDVMNYGYDLDYEGEGEILDITSLPQPGRRTVAFDREAGVITGEQFKVMPSPYVLTRYGSRDHQVALTFDDGPDPDVTPRILDILRQTKVPATFFVIGVNGEEHPELLRREVAEGHELGNHTFTHPNIATIRPLQFRLELSATQRLFESVVGRQSYLFRAPYAEDAEPETADQVRPLEIARERGYISVGMKVDPGDWERPGVQAIVQRTVEQLDQRQGNIVLLHDGGGDRGQTIAALPLMIAQLRKRGYRFVSVSDLLGRSRDDVMPRLTASERWGAWTDRAAFLAVYVATGTLRWLFFAGIALGALRLIFIGTLAAMQTWRARHRAHRSSVDLSVAVVVPAYNEAKVVVQTVTSLLACDHPSRFEVIVVDDGSSDDTAGCVEREFATDERVRVFVTANRGKAAALNHGVARTDADIIVALDADTMFARDTIRKLVRHFDNPRVGAVAGNAKVGNRINLLTRWQALEYVTSQNLDRRAFDVLNCITVVPGAVGAWRRELVERAGGFSSRTLAEDADLTLAIRRLGYSIRYEEEAVALTEAPDTLSDFIRQRYRWMYGTFQAAWKHADALFRPRYGSLGFVALPNIFVFQVLFPLISPVMDLLLVVSLVATALGRWQHPAEFASDTFWRVLFYYAVFQAIDFLTAVLAFALERRENFRLLVLLFWQRFFYRQVMYYVAIRSILASVKGGPVGWNKVERKATVSQV